jgi:hypothetical protein
MLCHASGVRGRLVGVLNRSDIYGEWVAPPEWHAIVACLSEQRVTADIEHRVVPNGCADVIVSSNGAVVVGLADGPVVHHLAAGSALRGLRLRPEAVATFFGVPADKLRNLNVALDDVVGSGRAGRLVDVVLDGAADGTIMAKWCVPEVPGPVSGGTR